MKIELFPGRKEINEQFWNFEFGEMDLGNFLTDFYQTGRVRLAAQTTGKDYHMTGELFAPAVLECSRCLESFRLPVQVSLAWIVCRVEELTPEDELPDGEFEILPETQELDFTARIRETIIFNLPAKPLCRSDCRGLCPACGQNLNVRECVCRREAADPRWDGLKRLIQ
ncbi:MAG: YceD family protein [Limisphaerales bacterium]